MAVFAVKTMACDGQHGSCGAASLHGLVLAMRAYGLFILLPFFMVCEHFTVRLGCPQERDSRHGRRLNPLPAHRDARRTRGQSDGTTWRDA